MQEEAEEFRDDDLRQALRRAMEAPVAPAALRGRVQAAMADDAALPLQLRPPAHLLRGHRVAIAASVLGLLGGYLVYQVTHQPEVAPLAMASSAALPPPVAYSLAEQHLTAVSQQLLQPAAPASEADFQTARQSLQRKLRLTMPTAELRAHGWRFCGAATCQLNGVDAAHFRFARGKENLSLFVLPQTPDLPQTSGYYTAEGATQRGKAPVLCKVQDNALLCLMGNAADRQAMTLQQLRPLLDAITLR